MLVVVVEKDPTNKQHLYIHNRTMRERENARERERERERDYLLRLRETVEVGRKRLNANDEPSTSPEDSR